MNVVKDVFGKAASVVSTGASTVTRTYSFLTTGRWRSTSQPTDQLDSKYELDPVTEGPSFVHESFEAPRSNPSPPPPENLFPDEDEVLYQKTNVLLKYPTAVKRDSPSDAISSDNQVFIPGLLFIRTRGSNFGTTLILNWAPSSSLRVPNNDHTPLVQVHPTGAGSATATEEYTPSCSSVSIDLGLMEIIRIFYHMDENGRTASGEMVISSKDRNFKVFRFRHGGLQELIQLFSSWKLFNHSCHKESHQHTFTIFRPKLSLSELHPEEGSVKSVLTEEVWRSLMDHEGRILDSHCVLKVVFFQGVCSSLRWEVWPFLLDLYRFDSTERERARVRRKREEEYKDIITRRRRQEVRGRQEFELSVVQQIDKDVVRTDRSNPYYRGEDNEHVHTLKNILINYLVYKPEISYSQGMTDLLAPLLAALDDEAEAFWCFTRLVESTAFFKPARNHISVEKQLEPLRMLIKMLIPWFYAYLEQTEGGLSLMFCHRWLLVCLKREFTDEDTLSIWEACWSNYETQAFHLFICIAIMAVYGQKAVERNMNINELMVFFNTLSHSMPRDVVLSQARGYLYHFCRSATVHCSLDSVMHKDFWDKPSSPKLMCNVCKGMGNCEKPEFLMDREAVC